MQLFFSCGFKIIGWYLFLFLLSILFFRIYLVKRIKSNSVILDRRSEEYQMASFMVITVKNLFDRFHSWRGCFFFTVVLSKDLSLLIGISDGVLRKILLYSAEKKDSAELVLLYLLSLDASWKIDKIHSPTT